MPRVPTPPTTGTGEEILQQLDADLPQSEPDITGPPETDYKLASWYVDPLLGTSTQDFTVRELNGYDEEALGRITNTTALLLPALLERGLESVGGLPADKDVVDGLLAGDWETVLLAIRCVTFGSEAEMRKGCQSCGISYEFTLDLTDIPQQRHESPEDTSFTHTVEGVTYSVDMPTGATQRKLFGSLDKSIAEQNTLVLADCVTRIGNRASLGMEDARKMPMLARRQIAMEINVNRRPGPKLLDVTTRCPSCGEVNPTPVTLGALFQF